MCTVVSSICDSCGYQGEVTVDTHVLEEWLSTPHALVRDSFPELSPIDKEILIGHRMGWYLCELCWDCCPDELR